MGLTSRQTVRLQSDFVPPPIADKPAFVRPNTGKRLAAYCPEGQTSELTWQAFRDRYDAVAKETFKPATFRCWRSAARAFERFTGLENLADLTPDLLARWEADMVRRGYSHNVVEGNLSRLHHAIITACDSGYLHPDTFGIGPAGSSRRWPHKPRGTWTGKAKRVNDRPAVLKWADVRLAFEAANPELVAARVWTLAADDFERLCAPERWPTCRRCCRRIRWR